MSTLSMRLRFRFLSCGIPVHFPKVVQQEWNNYWHFEEFVNVVAGQSVEEEVDVPSVQYMERIVQNLVAHVRETVQQARRHHAHSEHEVEIQFLITAGASSCAEGRLAGAAQLLAR